MLAPSRGLALLLTLSACSRSAEREAPEHQAVATPVPAPSTARASEEGAQAAHARFDVHIHLVEPISDELLSALERAGIEQAVLMASPHLESERPPGADGFAHWRDANERLLRQTAPHAGLFPFITVDPAAVEVHELERWFEQGACGVKLYMGHRSFHAQPLDAPIHAAMFEWLERRHVPVLLHVNTFRYEHELDALLSKHPELELVCPHLCGSRTDLDRLERLLDKHPKLRVDTSHGPGRPGIDGFLNVERERERLARLIHAEPTRFLFGSDLLTLTAVSGDIEATRSEWDLQLRANLGLLEAESFEFYRPKNEHGALMVGNYRGLALEATDAQAVLAGNARAWLASCIDPPAQTP